MLSISNWLGANSEVLVSDAKLGLSSFRFFFDFSPTYVGVGMICPYIVNVSVLLGGILSWGVMWPLIAKKKGSWYPADLEDSSLHGLQAYRVNIDPTYGCSVIFSQSYTIQLHRMRTLVL